MATSSSNTAYLTLKEFPSEFENVYLSTSSRPPTEGTTAPALHVPHDRRKRITEGYPGIGLLRAEFDGQVYQGVATLIADGSYILTCAHVVADYDPIDNNLINPTSVAFELRENNAMSSGSALMRRYSVTNIAVYPPYITTPLSHSGYDLAIGQIQVPEGDNFVKELYSKYSEYMPRLLAGEYSTTRVAVVGFPAEHKDEKWGMVADVPDNLIEDWKFKKEEQKEILVYDFIDTSSGQGGSPVMGMSPRDVIGVHTGGSAILKKNWATYLTPAKLMWIADSLGIPIKKDSNSLYI